MNDGCTEENKVEAELEKLSGKSHLSAFCAYIGRHCNVVSEGAAVRSKCMLEVMGTLGGGWFGQNFFCFDRSRHGGFLSTIH